MKVRFRDKVIAWIVTLTLVIGLCPGLAYAAEVGSSGGLRAAQLEDDSEPIEFAQDVNITNNTNMFKAVSGTAVENTDGSYTLTMALSSTGYHYLYKGTYEQAAANGTAIENWIAGYENADGKWEFQIPIAADELGADVPVVAVSQSYYEKYLNGQNPIERAFYPRQLKLDVETPWLTTGDYETSKQIKVTNNISMFRPAETATLECVGGPNSNNYAATLVLPMTTASLSEAFVGYPDEAAAADSTIAFDAETNTFRIPVKWVETFGDPTTTVNLANGEPFTLSTKSASNGNWYGRTATLDEEAGTLVFDPFVDPRPANTVDELIAKIQSQVFTDTTWADCEAAKAAWDALSDAEKALVEEYDYFGLDTGDASLDDPLNQDEIGENEILVVSFGTSFNDSRVATIGGVEKAIAEAYPEWSVRRAFTAQIIINHIYARDGEKIDNVAQALDRAVANGVKNLVVQPTHLMHGAEYDELVSALEPYQSQMSITVAEPLLGEVGADATVVNDDKLAVAKAVVEAADVPSSTALVLMGHGTAHVASVTYEQMQTAMAQLGYSNVFVGTVEGEPVGTDAAAIINKVKAAGYREVVLRPLMVVAGDHANNDMADPDDEESWYSQFVADEAFSEETVTCQIAGLGQIPAVQQIYVDHIAAALEPAPIELVDGTYAAKGLSTAVLNMYHFDPATARVVVKGDDAWLITSIDGAAEASTLNRFDGMAYGPQSAILDPSDETNHTLVEGAPVANVVETLDDGGNVAVRTFVLPVPKSVLATCGDIYYMIKYRAGYSASHDGDWYKASGGDYYLTGYTLELVSDDTTLPGEEDEPSAYPAGQYIVDVGSIKYTSGDNYTMFVPSYNGTANKALVSVDEQGGATINYVNTRNTYKAILIAELESGSEAGNLGQLPTEEQLASDAYVEATIPEDNTSNREFTYAFDLNDLGKTVPYVTVSRSNGKLNATQLAFVFADTMVSLAVYDVEQAIDALPAAADITVLDKDAIEAARAAYDALTAKQQAQVTNYNKLVAAEEAFAALDPMSDEAQAVAAALDALVQTYPEVNETTAAAVAAARTAYNELPAQQQAYIPAEIYAKLARAEACVQFATAENVAEGWILDVDIDTSATGPFVAATISPRTSAAYLYIYTVNDQYSDANKVSGTVSKSTHKAVGDGSIMKGLWMVQTSQGQGRDFVIELTGSNGKSDPITIHVPEVYGPMAEGTYEVEAVQTPSSAMRKFQSSTIVSDGTNMTATFVMPNTTYGKVYLGTKEAAEAATEGFIEPTGTAPTSGTTGEGNVYTIPLESMYQPIVISYCNTGKNTWTQETIEFVVDEQTKASIDTTAALELNTYFNVTADQREAVFAAYTLYDALDDNGKALADIANGRVALQTHAMFVVADETAALIEPLPESANVTEADIQAICEAKKSFDNMGRSEYYVETTGNQLQNSQIEKLIDQTLRDKLNADLLVIAQMTADAINALPDAETATSTDGPAVEAARNLLTQLQDSNSKSSTPGSLTNGLTAAEAAVVTQELIDKLEAVEEAALIDKVRIAIKALSADPTEYTADDKAAVEAIWADFQALSAEDQATLDAECTHSGTSQSLGRVLESALWSVWSYETDTSTTLADKTYTTTSEPAVSSLSNKGKSDSSRVRNWWVESVVVADGQATAYIYVTEGDATASKLTSYPSVWVGGKTVDRNSDNNYAIPIDLNGVTYFAGISSSMPTPIAYALTTEIEEPADYAIVDAAIAAVPADLSIYTEESVAALNAALDAVDRTKTIDEQEAVNAMAKAIDDAVAALVLTSAGEQAIEDDITAAEQAAKDADDAKKAYEEAADKAAQSKKAADEAAKTPGDAAVKAAEQATKDAEAAASAAAAYKTAAEAAKTAAAKALASAQIPGSTIPSEKVAELETAAQKADAAATAAAAKATEAEAAVTAAKKAQSDAVKAKEDAEKAASKTKANQTITAKAKSTKSFKANAKTGKLAKKKVIKLKKLAKVSAKTSVTFKKANKAGGKKIIVNKKTGKVTVKKGLKKGKYTVKIKLTAAANDSYNAAKAKTIRLIIRIK